MVYIIIFPNPSIEVIFWYKCSSSRPQPIMLKILPIMLLNSANYVFKFCSRNEYSIKTLSIS